MSLRENVQWKKSIGKHMHRAGKVPEAAQHFGLRGTMKRDEASFPVEEVHRRESGKEAA